MLGIDWLEEHRCVWDFGTGDLTIDGQPVITTTRYRYIRCQRVLAQGFQEIPPRSQRDVTARVTLQSVHDPVKDVIVETNQLRPGLYIGAQRGARKSVKVGLCYLQNIETLRYVSLIRLHGHIRLLQEAV